MQIDVFTIQKGDDEYESINARYAKLIGAFANINTHNIFSKNIAKAHAIGAKQAKQSYSDEYLPRLDGGFNIALCERGQMLDSAEFARLLDSRASVRFFIGGAYGFDESFVNRCDKALSLSRLTFAHKMVKAVLLEQIYRGLCINHSHPYHK